MPFTPLTNKLNSASLYLIIFLQREEEFLHCKWRCTLKTKVRQFEENFHIEDVLKTYLENFKMVICTSVEKKMIGMLARRRRQSSPIILLIEVGQV